MGGSVRKYIHFVTQLATDLQDSNKVEFQVGSECGNKRWVEFDMIITLHSRPYAGGILLPPKRMDLGV